jgi:hypothetical protein
METILVIHTHNPPQETTLNHSPVSLPNLHSIELGVHEVRSGLITYPRFPAIVAAGFRSLESSDITGGNIPPAVVASLQHILGGDLHPHRHLCGCFPTPRGTLAVSRSF